VARRRLPVNGPCDVTAVVHKLIRQTARDRRRSLRVDGGDNAFFAEWPNRRVFVRKNWPMFVDNARESLLLTSWAATIPRP
jgi:hypothetical protein